MDLFTWSIKDVLIIEPNFICHQLAISLDAMAVVQKKRTMGEEKMNDIRQETNKLMEVGFVREIKYPTWLANVMIVKMGNRNWIMCNGYTDLNRTCPKDSYRLPNINKFVDGASSHDIVSLMDAYLGYN